MSIKKSALAILFLSCCPLLSAARPTLSSNMQAYEIVRGANGSQSKLPARQLRAQSIIEYNLTYTNSANKALNGLVVSGPIPPGTVYIDGSASTTVAHSLLYSSDGGATFSRSKPPVSQITNLRWKVSAIPANGRQLYTYRVKVNGSSPTAPPSSSPRPQSTRPVNAGNSGTQQQARANTQRQATAANTRADRFTQQGNRNPVSSPNRPTNGANNYKAPAPRQSGNATAERPAADANAHTHAANAFSNAVRHTHPGGTTAHKHNYGGQTKRPQSPTTAQASPKKSTPENRHVTQVLDDSNGDGKYASYPAPNSCASVGWVLDSSYAQLTMVNRCPDTVHWSHSTAGLKVQCKAYSTCRSSYPKGYQDKFEITGCARYTSHELSKVFGDCR